MSDDFNLRVLGGASGRSKVTIAPRCLTKAGLVEDPPRAGRSRWFLLVRRVWTWVAGDDVFLAVCVEGLVDQGFTGGWHAIVGWEVEQAVHPACLPYTLGDAVPEVVFAEQGDQPGAAQRLADRPHDPDQEE